MKYQESVLSSLFLQQWTHQRILSTFANWFPLILNLVHLGILLWNKINYIPWIIISRTYRKIAFICMYRFIVNYENKAKTLFFPVKRILSKIYVKIFSNISINSSFEHHTFVEYIYFWSRAYEDYVRKTALMRLYLSPLVHIAYTIHFCVRVTVVYTMNQE